MNEQIKNYIYSHKDEMLGVLSELIAIPSVKGEPSDAAPFGTEPKRALEKMNGICGSAGLKTELVANAVGTADLLPPDGSFPALGILCHLDVVPVNAESWDSDPFKMTIREGVIYGRGAIDDKGPLAAAFMAVKCVKELGLPLKKGVRLLYGTDEENGSEDLELYLKERKLPENVFTPDASFPIINIEKGMMRSRFSGKYGSGSILSFHGGKIPNAVADSAECVLTGIGPDIAAKAVGNDRSGAEFTVENEGDSIRIICKGRSAHASTPESGINAVTALIKLLLELPMKDGGQKKLLSGLNDILPFGETDGKSMGLKAEDKSSGALTCVFSIFDMENGGCNGCIDVRFPTCLTLAAVESAERAALNKAGCSFDGYMGDEPHCTDENSDFVRKLLEVYEDAEGGKGRCIAIGGGTYVHNIEGGVAFGVERGDTDYHMHGANEFITVDELLDDAVLFAEAIAAICC